MTKLICQLYYGTSESVNVIIVRCVELKLYEIVNRTKSGQSYHLVWKQSIGKQETIEKLEGCLW